MRFEEQPRDAHRNASAGEIEHLTAPAARRIRAIRTARRIDGAALLQRVRHVEDDGRVVRHLFHHTEAEHVDDEIVVAEIRTAIAQHDAVVADLAEFLDHVRHLRRAEKLRLLHIDRPVGSAERLDEVGLPREECR